MDAQTPDPEELRSVKELAEEYGLAESTVWLQIKRHGLARYRVPRRPRLTLIRRGDFDRAINTPVPIEREGDEKGEAAA
jgi:hypothetical protein